MTSKKPASNKRAVPPKACDFLLIYRLDGSTIIFVRAGTHSGLFEE